VLEKEVMDFEFDHKYTIGFSTPNSTATVAIVMLYGVTNNYTMDQAGNWVMSNSSWTTFIKRLQLYYNGSPDNLVPSDYQTLSVTSKQIPEAGYINVLLFRPNPIFTSDRMRFRGLKFSISTPFNGYNDETITGIQSIYTKTIDVRNNFEDEIFAVAPVYGTLASKAACKSV